MNHRITLLIISVLLVSCTINANHENIFSDKEIRSIEFPVQQNLKGTPEDIDMYGVSDITIADTILILSTPKNDKLYRIVSLNNKQTYKDIVSKGRSDNELLQSYLPLYYTLTNDAINVSIHDYITKRVRTLNLTQSTAQSPIFDSIEEFSTQNLPGLYYIHPLSDSVYFVDYLNMNEVNQQYAYFNIKSGQLTDIDIAIKGERIFNVDKCYLLAGATVLNSEKGIYACAMKYFNQINILSLNDPHSSYSISARKSTNQSISQTVQQGYETQGYYADLASTPNYIIGLYTYLETDDAMPTLHILDWNGNAVTEIQLDKPVERIEIDTRHNIIYGLTTSEELFSYDLGAYI